MPTVRDQRVRVAAFAGGGESVPALGRHGPRQHHLLADRAVGHPGAVPRDRDADPRVVRTAVEFERGVDRRVGREPGLFREGDEGQRVKPASRPPDPMFAAAGGLALRLEPGREDQILRPAAVAQGRRRIGGPRPLSESVPQPLGMLGGYPFEKVRARHVRTPRCRRRLPVPNRLGTWLAPSRPAAGAVPAIPSRPAPRAADRARRQSS